MSSQILIFVNKHKTFRRLLYDKSFCVDIKVCGLSRKRVQCARKLKYQLKLVCIETLADLLRCLVLGKNVCCERSVFIVGHKIKLSKGIKLILGTRIIRCAREDLLEGVTVIVNAVTQKGVLQLNSADLLNLFTQQEEGELHLKCASGKKELVLYRIFSFWNEKKTNNCVLLHIVGNISLQDICDVYSIINCDCNFRFSCTYVERDLISVFSLWRVNE